MRRIVPALLAAALLVASCRTGGEIEPIVIDLSKKTATPAPTATAAPPAATPPASPTALPSPAPPMSATPTAPAPSPPPSSASVRSAERALSPEEVVRQHLDAVNRRDLDALLRGFAADAQLFEGLDGRRERGVDRIREVYARRFSEAGGARVSVARRIVEGPYVVEHEVLSGTSDERTPSAIVIYRVEQGKITAVWFLERGDR